MSSIFSPRRPAAVTSSVRFLIIAAASWISPIAAAADYAAAVAAVARAAEEEIRAGRLTGVSLALVDDQQLVFAGGFGLADQRRRVPASSETVYRAGSISKLFTALAAMQLVERGRLELDAPIEIGAPDFRIVNPFPDVVPITLRQLMCHRSGLVREAPVGGYFDDSEPGTARTVASLAGCVLVHPPNSRTKYSNSGVTVVGRAVEHAAVRPFPEHLAAAVLSPMGMRDSAFLLTRPLKPRLATGYLPVAESEEGFREINAPHFEFGILPAGNLYTTAPDLARFLACLFSNGRVRDGTVISPDSLVQMWTVQLTGQTSGFGLGFSLGRFRGHATFGHMGAVYGFTSILTGLPVEKLGVVVLANDDLVVGPVRRLRDVALEALLAAKLGEPPAQAPPQPDLDAVTLGGFAGDYESEGFWARLDPLDGSRLRAVISRQECVLTPVEPLRFKANGRLFYDEPFVFERRESGLVTGFTGMGQTFHRVEPGDPAFAPEAWRGLTGSYGPRFIPLIVSIRHGHLYAMTENEFDYRLTPLNRTVFQMPPGLYEEEQIVFQTDSGGRAHTAVLANMALKRFAR